MFFSLNCDAQRYVVYVAEVERLELSWKSFIHNSFCFYTFFKKKVVNHHPKAISILLTILPILRNILILHWKISTYHYILRHFLVKLVLPTVQHFGPPTVGTNPDLHVAHLTLSNLCQTRANDHDLHKSITIYCCENWNKSLW